MKRMLRVGITGGIGAGKSTVARMFGELGWALVDADQLAREVVARGEKALEVLVETFGQEILDARGELDRAALGRRVFSDSEARGRLEAILHPVIAARAEQRFLALGQQGAKVVLYEAALLIEAGRHEEMDRLIVVVADEATRVRRLRARDGLSEEAVRLRLAAQWPQEKKAALADHVIDNSQSLADTRRQVEDVWRIVGR